MILQALTRLFEDLVQQGKIARPRMGTRLKSATRCAWTKTERWNLWSPC